MFQPEMALVTAADLNISGKEYFSSVPDGPFNSISAYMELDDYQELHITIHKNKQCEAHWKNNLRQYTHRSKPLFDKFTSLDSLRFVFARKIDVRDWKLHLTGLKGHYGNSATLTHNGSFHPCMQKGRSGYCEGHGGGDAGGSGGEG